MWALKRQEQDPAIPLVGTAGSDNEDDVCDGYPEGKVDRHLHKARHRLPSFYSFEGESGHRRNVVSQENTTPLSCPGQHLGVLGPSELGVLNPHDVDVRQGPSEPSKNAAVEILVDGQLQHDRSTGRLCESGQQLLSQAALIVASRSLAAGRTGLLLAVGEVLPHVVGVAKVVCDHCVDVIEPQRVVLGNLLWCRPSVECRDNRVESDSGTGHTHDTAGIGQKRNRLGGCRVLHSIPRWRRALYRPTPAEDLGVEGHSLEQLLTVHAWLPSTPELELHCTSLATNVR